MFAKSLDSKPKYINDDGIEMVDIMQNMYNGTYAYNLVHSVYKANSKCTMRPDYLAACLYGDEAYAEVAMKSSMLSNPFALEKNDIIYALKINDVYTNINTNITDADNNSLYELIKRYHKYIDPDKVPDAVGSEENKTEAKKTKGGLEPNISKTGKTGVTIKDGKIFFGKNTSANSVSDRGSSRQELEEPQSAAATGTLPSSYSIESTIDVKSDNSLYFDLNDDIKENYDRNDTVSNNDIEINEGKIYFTSEDGIIERDIEMNVNSDMIDCAKSGVSLGTFLNSAINSCNINTDEL